MQYAQSAVRPSCPENYTALSYYPVCWVLLSGLSFIRAVYRAPGGAVLGGLNKMRGNISVICLKP